MLQTGQCAPAFQLDRLDGSPWSSSQRANQGPTIVVFFEADCPTCHLTLPYLDRLAEIVGSSASIVGISQDDAATTRGLMQQIPIHFPVLLDRELNVSRAFDPESVPAIFMLDETDQVRQTSLGFDKDTLNKIAAAMLEAAGLEPVPIADEHDGAPQAKPGCVSRHREGGSEKVSSASGQADGSPAPVYAKQGSRASRIELDDDTDLDEYCRTAGFADPLPVVPPTVKRVERMLAATQRAADEIIAHVPPCYGPATVEKIAANAVMAGCEPPMMRVLVPLVRAACDERFNLHGAQATTHFAAPLVIVNGPVRRELGFACGQNVFSNVARANSTLGRALQLILLNLGGARPTDIDMSTLGNPGKFSFCIAENEELSPWEPLHVEQGFRPEQSTVTLLAAEPPRGVSEHMARRGQTILKAISRTLATVWTYRACVAREALVVICPEHVETLKRDGFSKQQVRQTLYDITGVPVSAFDEEGEGTEYVPFYEKITIDGVPCYRKFQTPEAIRIMVAGGTAGKFSAVIGNWVAGPVGSQMVTYPVDDN